MRTVQNVVGALALVALGAMGLSDPAMAAPAELDSATRGQLARLKVATARFHDIRVAELEGYSNSGLPCIEGMGYHWRKPSLVGTAIADQPSVLVYDLQPDGFMKLVAADWVTFINPVNPAPPQELFGQTFHLPTWPGGPTDRYVLHAWVWLHNEDGMFADTNPKLRCPTP
ncbi:MAG: hypothetical protein LC667_14325 [Thioalkalivibrio sp.]|nr:hypothetical protein [Thioalkalivibrio sp.]